MPVERVFYVASTGRSGTRPMALILATATNAKVIHEPPPFCYEEGFRLADLYSESWERFLAEDTFDTGRYPELAQKSSEHEPVEEPVYGQTLNSMFPFCVHYHRLYEKLGIRFQCIHLMRDPVKTASSILRAERPSRGHGGWRRYRAASFIPEAASEPEIAATVWVRINEMIRRQMEYIDDGSNTMRLWIEDLDVEGYRSLFDWLGLEGFDEGKVAKFLHDDRFAVRHSHQWDLDRKGQPSVTPEEQAVIRAITDSYIEETYGVDPSRFSAQRAPVPAINFPNQAFTEWDGHVPLSWQLTGGGKVKREDADIFDASPALRLEAPTGFFRRETSVSQTVALPVESAGHELVMKSQVKADAPGVAHIQMEVVGEAVPLLAADTHCGNGKWEILEAVLAVPEGAQGKSIRIHARRTRGAGGAALFDGFTVTARRPAG